MGSIAVVTGAAGFLGSHLCERLLDHGHEVVGVDNMLGGDFINIPDGVLFHPIDCRNTELLTDVFRGAEVVYHLAAAPHEGLSVFSPMLINEHTYMSSVSVMTAAVCAGVRRVVFTSSAARYGRGGEEHTSDGVCREWMIARPVDPYGVAKVASEDVIQVLGDLHGVQYTIAVPHNIIGPRQKYDDPYRNVASIMMNLMMQGRQPVIYGDGNQTRSFCFVGDCVDALVRLGFRGSWGGLYNIGPGNDTITVNELAQRIAKLLEFTLDPVYVPDRPGEVRHVHVSSELAKQELGYEQYTGLDRGLELMIEWIRQHGPKPFVYHLPIEINNEKVPKTWKDRLL